MRVEREKREREREEEREREKKRGGRGSWRARPGSCPDALVASPRVTGRATALWGVGTSMYYGRNIFSLQRAGRR